MTALGIPGTIFKCHNIIGFRACKDKSDYIAENGPGILWDRVGMTLQGPWQLFPEPQQWWEMERNRWLQWTLILVIHKSDFCLLWLIWQCMETFSSAPVGKKCQAWRAQVWCQTSYSVEENMRNSVDQMAITPRPRNHGLDAYSESNMGWTWKTNFQYNVTFIKIKCNNRKTSRYQSLL